MVLVSRGKALDECLETVLAWSSGDAGAEVLVVDRRGDPGDALDVAGVLAALGARGGARLLSVPGAPAVEAERAGLAAARGGCAVVIDESVRTLPGLIDDLLVVAGCHPRPGGPRLEAGLADRLDLIQALQRGLVRGRDAEFVERAVLAAAERIRETLMAEPERHGEVVAGARERGVDLPWSVVNRGRARDLAVLHNFVPFIDTSGLVAARRLREWGVVTDVVSQDLSSRARRDDAGMRIPAEVLDEARILPGKRHDHRWSSVVAFTAAVLREVGDLEAAKGPYRSVYSRAMPPASHVAAAILKLRSPDLRWVAEFSDPLLQNAYGQTRNGDVEDDWLRAELSAGFRRHEHAVPDTDRLFGWAELVAYAFADEIVFTNQHQLDFMLGYCADPALAARAAGISRVIHHPVPSPELYRLAQPSYSLEPGKLHLGYFGNFYPNRGLTEITGALDALSLAERDRLQLHVFTSKPDVLTEEVLELGLADVIRVAPMFGYLEYLNLTTRFDLLVINDYATSPHYVPNPYLPAKLADYRGSGTPIWALYEPGSVLSATDVEHATPLGDVGSATQVLRTLLEHA